MPTSELSRRIRLYSENISWHVTARRPSLPTDNLFYSAVINLPDYHLPLLTVIDDTQLTSRGSLINSDGGLSGVVEVR